MTPKQRKDACANALLSMGVNKTSIIAILCNGATESAHTFNPALTQFGMDHAFSAGCGVGIFQWSNYPENQNMYNYVANHSEEDGIKYEMQYLVNHPGQWVTAYLPSRMKMSFQDFLHNTKNLSWQDLTFAWCYGWERPYDTTTTQQEGIKRQSNYNEVMPINWSGSAPAGGNNTGKPGDNQGDKQHKFKKLSMSECLALLNKMRQQANQSDGQESNNNKGPETGGSNGFDTNLCESEFNSHINQTIYELNGLRAHVWSDWKYSDCSAFVSRMVIDGWHLNNHHGELYTTETLHGFLKSIGYKCVESHASPNMTVPGKPGDVFIMGQIGTSLGGNGHALISLDGKGMWECQGSVSPALKHTATINQALQWDAYGNWCSMIYHYQKG